MSTQEYRVLKPQERPIPPPESPEDKRWWRAFFAIFISCVLIGLGLYFFWLSTWEPSPVLNL